MVGDRLVTGWWQVVAVTVTVRPSGHVWRSIIQTNLFDLACCWCCCCRCWVRRWINTLVFLAHPEMAAKGNHLMIASLCNQRLAMRRQILFYHPRQIYSTINIYNNRLCHSQIARSVQVYCMCSQYMNTRIPIRTAWSSLDQSVNSRNLHKMTSAHFTIARQLIGAS